MDFGLLDEAFQKEVLQLLAADVKNRQQLVRINPFLGALPRLRPANELIASNRQAILKHYGPESYRRLLIETYRQVAATPVRQHIDRSVLAAAFLDLEQFSLLKWNSYHG